MHYFIIIVWNRLIVCVVPMLFARFLVVSALPEPI